MYIEFSCYNNVLETKENHNQKETITSLLEPCIQGWNRMLRPIKQKRTLIIIPQAGLCTNICKDSYSLTSLYTNNLFHTIYSSIMLCSWVIYLPTQTMFRAKHGLKLLTILFYKKKYCYRVAFPTHDDITNSITLIDKEISILSLSQINSTLHNFVQSSKSHLRNRITERHT